MPTMYEACSFFGHIDLDRNVFEMTEKN